MATTVLNQLLECAGWAGLLAQHGSLTCEKDTVATTTSDCLSGKRNTAGPAASDHRRKDVSAAEWDSPRLAVGSIALCGLGLATTVLQALWAEHRLNKRPENVELSSQHAWPLAKLCGGDAWKAEYWSAEQQTVNLFNGQARMRAADSLAQVACIH